MQTKHLHIIPQHTETRHGDQFSVRQNEHASYFYFSMNIWKYLVFRPSQFEKAILFLYIFYVCLQ